MTESKSALRVLVVEDSDQDAELVLRGLLTAGYTVQSARVETEDELRSALCGQPWDVILADYRLPQFDAPQALRVVHSLELDVPFIVISGKIGEETAVEIMKAGAHDYLLKGNLARLAPAIEREIREARLREDRRRQEKALVALAHELEAALAEKTMLVREIHHRVRNDLTIVSSLLDLKAADEANPEVSRALEESQRRVRSIALIHESLYSASTTDCLDFATYARQISEELRSALAAVPGLISIDFDLQPIQLEVQQAIPCGLILNELLTNAFKYAFPNQRPGQVKVSLNRTADSDVQLAVEDDGVGCPANVTNGGRSSLGTTIVKSLAKQLGGAVVQEPSKGARFVLRFPGLTVRTAAVSA